SINGHAIEARLYAEDPENDFLPTTGRVLSWQPSATAPARFDSGIETGDEVGIEFDPMLAKVIAHAPTRREAALRLARALETTRLQGIVTNRDFLVATLRSAEFLAGDTTTDFIERVALPRRRVPAPAELAEAGLLAAMAAQSDRRAASRSMTTLTSGWRNTVMPPEEVSYRSGAEELTVEYRSRRNGSFWARVRGNEHSVRVHSRERDSIGLEIDGRRVAATISRDREHWSVHGPSGNVDLVEIARFPARVAEAEAGGLVAPMPAKVLSIHVALGDRVEPGQLLVVLEAMKMEHLVTAPRAGAVAEIRVQAGDQVAGGEILVVLSDDESDDESA
ncbi:MAG: biotin/lipoyl-containing protein, partial [Myxococcota bacterium]